MELGVSLPDLFQKFGAQLYKSQVLQGQDKLKSKENETGGEPLLTDLINEDMIAELTRKVTREDYKEYSEFQKYAEGIDKVANPDLYETKKAEYVRNIMAPKEAYKKLQE